MGDIDIQLPKTWDLRGILFLVLQILGITWANIRVKLVKKVGEDKVRAAEKSVAIIKALVTKGPIALWDLLQSKAAEIKQKAMEGIRQWVILQIVKKGVFKLAMMLNPAGALIQAIIMIYDTVMFFIENWNRIVEFVKSIFDSIGDIAMGKVSAACTV